MSPVPPQRPTRAHLLPARVFAVPGFDAQPLDSAVLARHAGTLQKAEMLSCLVDGRPSVRLNAARVLGLLAPLTPAEAQTLAVALRDGDPLVRQSAAESLANVDKPAACVPALLDAGADAVAAVASAASATLHGYGTAILPELVALLAKAPDWVAARVLPPLARHGVDVLPHLLPLLAPGDPTLRANALAVLHHLDQAALQDILARLAKDKTDAGELLRATIADVLSRRERRVQSTSREAVAYPPGFEAELLDRATLAKQGSKIARDILIGALADGRRVVRINALETLATQGPLPAGDVPVVRVLLRDGSASVRGAAARLISLGKPVEVVLAALIEACVDKDEAVQRDAAAAIQAHGAAAMPTLMSYLRSEAAFADVAVLPHLAALGDTARLPLLTALRHPEPSVRANALAGLLLLGHDTLTPHVRMVADMTRDPAPEVASLARQALGILARSKPDESVERQLPHEDFAATLMGDSVLGSLAKKLSADALLALARDGRPLVRANAWRGLASMGALDVAGAQLSAVATKDSEPTVRHEACLALRHAPDGALEQVLPALVTACGDADKAVQAAARQAVFSLGGRGVPGLIALFGARDDRLGSTAVRLAVALDADAAKAVVAALGSPLPLVRENALRALAGIAGQPLDSARDTILSLLSDSHDGARVAAVQALLAMRPAARRGRADLLAIVQQVAKADPSLAVRNAAAGALAKLAAD